jgi:hypothetical protein
MRQARVARRRVAVERADAIRRMLNVPLLSPESRPRESHEPGAVITSSRAVVCPDCSRTFSLPMHLGRHRKAKHDRSDAA